MISPLIGRANEKIARLMLESWSSTGTLNRAIDSHPAYQALHENLEEYERSQQSATSKELPALTEISAARRLQRWWRRHLSRQRTEAAMLERLLAEEKRRIAARVSSLASTPRSAGNLLERRTPRDLEDSVCERHRNLTQDMDTDALTAKEEDEKHPRSRSPQDAKITYEELAAALSKEKVKTAKLEEFVTKQYDSLQQQRDLSMQQLHDAERTYEERIAAQKDDYEATLNKNYKLIDELIAEKQALTEQCSKLVDDMRLLKEKAEAKQKQLEDNHKCEIQKLQGKFVAAEKLRRERWEASKIKSIKELTIKGVEKEIARLVASHKEELEELRKDCMCQVQAADARAFQAYGRQLDELRLALTQEKEEACAKERRLANERFENLVEDERESLAKLRKRLLAENADERERMVATSARQREEFRVRTEQLESEIQKMSETHREEMEQLKNNLENKHATTVRAGHLSDAEVGAAAGDLAYVYYVHDLAPKHEHQDFTQQGVERLISHMCQIARGHVKKEPSQPDSQTTSQTLRTTHIGLTVRSECNCQLATFQAKDSSTVDFDDVHPRCQDRVKKTGDGRKRRWLARPEPPLGVPPHLAHTPSTRQFDRRNPTMSTSQIEELKTRSNAEREVWEQKFRSTLELEFATREREIAEKLRKDRDKQLEMVIRNLEAEATAAQEEAEKVTNGKLKTQQQVSSSQAGVDQIERVVRPALRALRGFQGSVVRIYLHQFVATTVVLKERHQQEINELEQSERQITEKYNQLRTRCLEHEGEIECLTVRLNQRETELKEVQALYEKLKAERDHVSDVVRQEFADRIVASEEEVKTLRVTLAETRSKLALEVDKRERDIQRAKESMASELEQVHERYGILSSDNRTSFGVKDAVRQKEINIGALKKEHNKEIEELKFELQLSRQRSEHLEKLLDQQRKQLLQLKPRSVHRK
ncbi:unnamed protein product [Schistocephalus solidus]|uniref:DUF4200 domain-containing protein n=1 Tax=Schistocephalus solidus TaxID=70667 RepID=A0A183SHT0_SCHSO|nr:unnamed protein product [Schistocephalus solidus]